MHVISSQGTKIMTRELETIISLTLFAFREVRPRENVTFLNESLLSYTQPKSYVFVPEMSAGSENDTFISVNIPILVSRV